MACRGTSVTFRLRTKVSNNIMSALRLPGTVVAVLVVLICCCAAYGQQQPLMVGVLADTPGVYAGEPNYSSARVVFYKDGAGWKAFPKNCPDESSFQAYSRAQSCAPCNVKQGTERLNNIRWQFLPIRLR